MKWKENMTFFLDEFHSKRSHFFWTPFIEGIIRISRDANPQRPDIWS